MIDIFSEKGEKYTYDPETGRIFRDGFLVSSVEAEPIFSNSPSPNLPPRFSGVLLKGRNEILTLSGKYNKVSDPNSII
jgi:hypothetical protein